MSTNNKKAKLHKREWDEEDKKNQKPISDDEEEEEEDDDLEGSQEDFEDDDEEEDFEDDDGEEVEDLPKSAKKSQKSNKNDDQEEEDDDEDDDDDMDDDSEDLIDITKKKDELEDEDEEDDDDEDEGEEEGEEQDILNVEMEFKDANETMFHSVKSLINGYLDGDDYNSSELADIIVKQYTLGTFISFDEEEDENQKKIREKAKLERETNVIGFCTLLSLKQHEKENIIKELLKFVNQKSEKCNNEADHQKFSKILEKNRVGLLLNERIINVAPQAIPVLHTQVQEDFKWVKQNHQKEFKENFDFEYLLCISRCAKEVKGVEDPQQGQKKVKKDELEQYLYPKFEDFCLLEKAEVKFFFEAAQSKSQSGLSKKNMDEIKSKEVSYKIVYLVKLSDYFKTIPEMPLHLSV